MKTIVISAINIYSSGPLVIVRDFLSALLSSAPFRRGELKVVVFCHAAELYKDQSAPDLLFIPKPLSRKNWLIRLFYEYVWFWFWSRKNDVDCWISLHDVTPNVRAKHRIVYCHNPSPFYAGKTTWRYAPGFQLFRYFYEYVYRLNLLRNDHVIVQQQWLRDAFVERYGCNPAKVIVARPEAETDELPPAQPGKAGEKPCLLVFPAFPRVFKNHEALVEAMRLLTDVPVKLVLTFAGNENAYARKIRDEASGLENVELSGFLSRADLFRVYAAADALVFPSKLETWGLPLSEFRRFNKPVFAADLPYARETLSGYQRACYLNPDDPAEWSSAIRRFVLNHEFSPVRYETTYAAPFACGWAETLELIGLNR